jgi:hypothetical protein
MCQKLIGVFLAKIGCAMRRNVSNKRNRRQKRRTFLVHFLYPLTGKNDTLLPLLLLIQTERYPVEEAFLKTFTVSYSPISAKKFITVGFSMLTAPFLQIRTPRNFMNRKKNERNTDRRALGSILIND